MHAFDPYVQQESRRAVSANRQQVRQQLHRHGRQLLQRALRLANHPATPVDVAMMIGELTQYLALRSSLATTAGLDGLDGEIHGTIRRLTSLLPAATPEQGATDEP